MSTVVISSVRDCDSIEVLFIAKTRLFIIDQAKVDYPDSPPLVVDFRLADNE